MSGSISSDAALTLEVMTLRRWPLVLCWPRSKKPAALKDAPWPITMNVDVARAHLARGGNVGLIAGPRSRVALLDPDEPEPWLALVRILGAPAAAWVRTGSGKDHLYVAWEPDLPAKLVSIDGEIIGEIQRGPVQQHCVAPPSVHPDTGQRYTWLVDPRTEPLRPLPPAWRIWLRRERRPVRSRRAWSEDGADDCRAAALAQPGARRRQSGRIKFQCPQCRADGHDRHQDNAILFADGRWGCAWAGGDLIEGPRHRAAIGAALGLTRRVRR